MSDVVFNNRASQANMVAVHQAAQMAGRQSTYIAIQQTARRRQTRSATTPATPSPARGGEDAYLSMAIRLSEREDPGDLPDYA